MQVSDRTVARVAMVLSALLHGVILAMLVHPPVATHTSAGADAGQGDALQVVFIMRGPQPPAAPRREADDAARAKGVAIGSDVVTSPPRVERGVDAGLDAQAGATRAAATGIVDRAVLDIALPEPRNRPPGAAAPVRGWLERPIALEPATTRFERAWVPAGDAIAQARFYSPAVDAALGLFGRPPRRCGEVERRLRGPDCLTLDPDEADTEALRRRLDRP